MISEVFDIFPDEIDSQIVILNFLFHIKQHSLLPNLSSTGYNPNQSIWCIVGIANQNIAWPIIQSIFMLELKTVFAWLSQNFFIILKLGT